MQFFERLVDAAGPSGDERLPARVWREYASAFADTRHDTLGSSFAEAVPDGDPKVAVFGHIDEIGLVINHADDEGYLWFGPLGGWDPEVLVGQRVRILGKDGPVAGVVGKKSRHHQDEPIARSRRSCATCGSTSAPRTQRTPPSWSASATWRCWSSRWCGWQTGASPRAPPTTAAEHSWLPRPFGCTPRSRARPR